MGFETLQIVSNLYERRKIRITLNTIRSSQLSTSLGRLEKFLFDVSLSFSIRVSVCKRYVNVNR